MEHPTKATLVIRRNDPTDCKARTVIVNLDGQRIGVLKYGDRLTAETTEGQHVIKLDNTWTTKTLSLEVAVGTTREFVTGNRTSGCAMFILAVTGAAPMGLIWREVEGESDA